ncbi:gag-pol polyprotein [Tanacetum coccineum]
MLATASLEKSFWAEAVNTACYVINRSPSTAIELKTLMEMWTGKPVNYSDLHIFQSPVYHLRDPTAHKVVVSRDVIFMEDKIQKNEEGDNAARETTSIHMEKEFQSNDYFEAAPQHESNVAYCLLREERELSTLQEALNNLNASKPIGNKWVYKIKRNGDDQVERYRARLVVKGYAQKEGIDFNEIFPLVVQMTTIRVVMPIYTTYDLYLEQLDVKTAFL